MGFCICSHNNPVQVCMYSYFLFIQLLHAPGAKIVVVVSLRTDVL